MERHIRAHTQFLKTTAIAVVCLFTFTTIAWSAPLETYVSDFTIQTALNESSVIRDVKSIVGNVGDARAERQPIKQNDESILNVFSVGDTSYEQKENPEDTTVLQKIRKKVNYKIATVLFVVTLLVSSLNVNAQQRTPMSDTARYALIMANAFAEYPEIVIDESGKMWVKIFSTSEETINQIKNDIDLQLYTFTKLEKEGTMFVLKVDFFHYNPKKDPSMRDIIKGFTVDDQLRSVIKEVGSLVGLTRNMSEDEVLEFLQNSIHTDQISPAGGIGWVQLMADAVETTANRLSASNERSYKNELEKWQKKYDAAKTAEDKRAAKAEIAQYQGYIQIVEYAKKTFGEEFFQRSFRDGTDELAKISPEMRKAMQLKKRKVKNLSMGEYSALVNGPLNLIMGQIHRWFDLVYYQYLIDVGTLDPNTNLLLAVDMAYNGGRNRLPSAKKFWEKQMGEGTGWSHNMLRGNRIEKGKVDEDSGLPGEMMFYGWERVRDELSENPDYKIHPNREEHEKMAMAFLLRTLNTKIGFERQTQATKEILKRVNQWEYHKIVEQPVAPNDPLFITDIITGLYEASQKIEEKSQKKESEYLLFYANMSLEYSALVFGESWIGNHVISRAREILNTVTDDMDSKKRTEIYDYLQAMCKAVYNLDPSNKNVYSTMALMYKAFNNTQQAYIWANAALEVGGSPAEITSELQEFVDQYVSKYDVQNEIDSLLAKYKNAQKRDLSPKKVKQPVIDFNALFKAIDMRAFGMGVYGFIVSILLALGLKKKGKGEFVTKSRPGKMPADGPATPVVDKRLGDFIAHDDYLHDPNSWLSKLFPESIVVLKRKELPHTQIVITLKSLGKARLLYAGLLLLKAFTAVITLGAKRSRLEFHKDNEEIEIDLFYRQGIYFKNILFFTALASLGIGLMINITAALMGVGTALAIYGVGWLTVRAIKKGMAPKKGVITSILAGTLLGSYSSLQAASVATLGQSSVIGLAGVVIGVIILLIAYISVVMSSQLIRQMWAWVFSGGERFIPRIIPTDREQMFLKILSMSNNDLWSKKDKPLEEIGIVRSGEATIPEHILSQAGDESNVLFERIHLVSA
ncbi:MAG: hypothetical protein JW938_04525 [Candidatus Omnitrophica bacterium]|nr:hypothetical protein [Candidatus Omnitrophota bacterium]